MLSENYGVMSARAATSIFDFPSAPTKTRTTREGRDKRQTNEGAYCHEAEDFSGK